MKKLYALLFAAMLPCAAATLTINGIGGAIPDNTPSGIEFTSNATEPGTITGMSLTLTGFSHTWAGDLIFKLTAPDGTEVVVLNRIGRSDAPAGQQPGLCAGFPGVGCGFDFSADNTYTFADGGALFTNSNPVPTGTYAPFQALSAFNGVGLAGTWTLFASDNSLSDTSSTSFNWTLNIDYTPTGTPDEVPEPATFALSALGLAGLWTARRRLQK